ncbi:MAG TPA: hypothetical protein DEF34_06855 [Desulfotomaculum sp.]|nr:hypothetical protein [Desulfotomaculum sp.]
MDSRSGVDYYPFTKEQLLKAGEAGYIDRTPAFIRFVDFILNHYEITREEAEEIAEQCIYLIQCDDKPSDIIKHLGYRLEFPSLEMVQLLTGEVIDLSNNTRMWILKGYTPEELFHEDKERLLPLPAVAAAETGAKVIDIRTRTKVGRNDPCPCGSGKKYKKCCGK